MKLRIFDLSLSWIIQVGPSRSMPGETGGDYIHRRGGDSDHGGRDWSDASTSQGTPTATRAGRDMKSLLPRALTLISAQLMLTWGFRPPEPLRE